jgi:hypothetical protein
VSASATPRRSVLAHLADFRGPLDQSGGVRSGCAGQSISRLRMPAGAARPARLGPSGGRPTPSTR